jgi:hypothetical protein
MEINLDSELCFICNMNKINVLLSCKHQLCRYCLKRLAKLECPFCRKDISSEFNIKPKKYNLEDYLSQDTMNLILNEDRRRENEENYINQIISSSYERPTIIEELIDDDINNVDTYLLRFTRTGRRIQQRENENRRIRQEKPINEQQKEKIKNDSRIKENRDIKYMELNGELSENLLFD